MIDVDSLVFSSEYVFGGLSGITDNMDRDVVSNFSRRIIIAKLVKCHWNLSWYSLEFAYLNQVSLEQYLIYLCSYSTNYLKFNSLSDTIYLIFHNNWQILVQWHQSRYNPVNLVKSQILVYIFKIILNFSTYRKKTPRPSSKLNQNTEYEIYNPK